MLAVGTTIWAGPKRWSDFARQAEEAGLESVWVPEHLVMPVAMHGKPNSPEEGEPPISAAVPAFDPWVQMATMTAVTTKLKVGTNVYNIGLRHPIITARAITTLDNVSQGRLVVGIGASWLRTEWEVMELDFDTRGRRVDESIEVIRRLFTEEVVEHHGEFYDFQPVGFLPKPVQQPNPPFLVGGDSRAAMRRAALLGDGWIPMEQTLETLPGNLETIRKMRADAGRTGPFEVTMSGSVQSREDVMRYEDAGVTRLLTMVNPRDPDGFKRVGDLIASL